MQKKVLITGATGFAGSYLAALLCEKKIYEVHGSYLTDDSVQNVSSLKDVIFLSKIDLTKKDDVYALIHTIKPDVVYHLAAFTSPADSFKNPSEAIMNNVTVQINLLEALREVKLLQTNILIVSSADVYGAVSPTELPISEITAFYPTNPYAVSKITQDYLGLQYFLSYKLSIVRVRPFNHVGPKQSPQFVVASFAKKIAEIEKGDKKPILTVGNLDAKRDFTDVRDMMSAYILAIEKGKPGEVYNIGSGKSHKISDIVEKLLSLSKTNITISTDPSLLRPSDTPDSVCDYGKFHKQTGWEPKIPIEQTLKETLDYWRSIV